MSSQSQASDTDPSPCKAFITRAVLKHNQSHPSEWATAAAKAVWTKSHSFPSKAGPHEGRRLLPCVLEPQRPHKRHDNSEAPCLTERPRVEQTLSSSGPSQVPNTGINRPSSPQMTTPNREVILNLQVFPAEMADGMWPREAIRSVPCGNSQPQNSRACGGVGLLRFAVTCYTGMVSGLIPLTFACCALCLKFSVV